MRDETFDWIWKQIELDIGFIGKKFDIDQTNSYNFRLTYGEATKNIIRDEYNRIKNGLKKRCYSSELNSQGDLNLIDQHKIAACLCKAFINKKVFSFDLKEEMPSDIVLSNYKLAYYVSLHIIYIFLLDYYLDPKTELDQKLKDSCIEKLCEWGNLKEPKTAQTHDAYNFGRIKTLALNDYYGYEVDLLMYADMMYWIEYYNKLLLEGKIDI